IIPLHIVMSRPWGFAYFKLINLPTFKNTMTIKKDNPFFLWKTIKQWITLAPIATRQKNQTDNGFSIYFHCSG
ncbi:MAG: hypothetical protein NTW06_04335, partial [Candidatus Falkowbacteria bacterium]|nr:hypothetical protein [Candidatus Falkowbacteria bacterium]